MIASLQAEHGGDEVSNKYTALCLLAPCYFAHLFCTKIKDVVVVVHYMHPGYLLVMLFHDTIDSCDCLIAIVNVISVVVCNNFLENCRM